MSEHTSNLPTGEIPGTEFAHTFIEALGAQPDVVTEILPDFDRPPVEQPKVFTYRIMDDRYSMTLESSSRPLARHLNAEDDMRQELRAVIKAGGELFGLVRAGIKETATDRRLGEKPGEVERYRWYDHTVVTNIEGQGRPAKIVGVLYGKSPLVFGRNKENGYDERMSGEHFFLQLIGGGCVRIKDLESTNRTEVVHPMNYREIAETTNAGAARIGLGALKRLVGRRQQPVPANPVEDSSVWIVEREDFQEQVKAAYIAKRSSVR